MVSAVEEEEKEANSRQNSEGNTKRKDFDVSLSLQEDTGKGVSQDTIPIPQDLIIADRRYDVNRPNSTSSLSSGTQEGNTDSDCVPGITADQLFLEVHPNHVESCDQVLLYAERADVSGSIASVDDDLDEDD